MPELQHKQHIIRLFNAGSLSIRDAQWYSDQGYALVCQDGLLVDIVPEEN